MGNRILGCHMLAGGTHESSFPTMEDEQQHTDRDLLIIVTPSVVSFLSVFGLGVAFLPASISYLIGTNLFGTFALRMGR